MPMIVTRSPQFIKQTRHLDPFLLTKLRAQIDKLLVNPRVGKPLKYRRNERSIYIKPFRLIYSIRGNEIMLLQLDHRKRVYK